MGSLFLGGGISNKGFVEGAMLYSPIAEQPTKLSVPGINGSRSNY